MAKIKKFKDVERNYIKTDWFPTKIGHKKFNDQIQIDLKRLIDGVMDERGISKYNFKKVSLNIPIDGDGCVTGNSLSLVIGKKRFTIRLQDTEIIPSKQQKIDYDNTHPHRWKMPQWLKFINHLFYEYYGIEATELAANTSVRRGRIHAKIKSLIERILTIKAFDTNHETVLEYLTWVFQNKHNKLGLTIALICSDNLIQEWALNKSRKNRITNASGKKRKWHGQK